MFGFEKDPSTLTLTLEIYVPVSMHYGPVEVSYQPYLSQNDVSVVDETFMLNSIDDYVPVVVNLDVEGVTSRNSAIPGGASIGVPYELAKKIYEQAVSTSIQLNEGSRPWVPNTYTVVMSGNASVDDCTEELDQFLSNYFIYQLRYNYNTIEQYKLSQ